MASRQQFLKHFRIAFFKRRFSVQRLFFGWKMLLRKQISSKNTNLGFGRHFVKLIFWVFFTLDETKTTLFTFWYSLHNFCEENYKFNSTFWEYLHIIIFNSTKICSWENLEWSKTSKGLTTLKSLEFAIFENVHPRACESFPRRMRRFRFCKSGICCAYYFLRKKSVSFFFLSKYCPLWALSQKIRRSAMYAK